MHLSTKTDLAKEIIAEKSPVYSKICKFYRGNTEITKIDIDSPKESSLFERPLGTYITVEADSIRLSFADFSEEAAALAEQLKALLPAKGAVLCVGLGNASLTADSLGPVTAGCLPCGEYKGRLLAALCPGTAGATGLEPEELIKAAVEHFAPTAAVLIDSLAAADLQAVCKTVQITNAGIAPGSGAAGAKTAITKENLGLPVIAIGTPTVIRYSKKEGVLVSPGDIDVKIKRAAKLIAAAITLAVFPEFDIETVKEML